MKVDDGLPNKNDFGDSLLELRMSGKLDFELTHKNLIALLLVSLSLSLSLSLYIYIYNIL